MTVLMVTTIKRYQGLSSDIKPEADTPEGSTYHEIDTGYEYVFHDSMWEQDLRRIVALQTV